MEKEQPKKQGTRLNKAIADAGYCSRRKADDLISGGHVRVNGRRITDLATRVETSDRIAVDGQELQRSVPTRYVLLNKPKDTITTTKDEKGRRTVLDLIKSRQRLYPVGRLDRATTGVLLLTNDGDLAHRMMHPRYQVIRTYKVRLDKEIALEDAKKIADGVRIGPGERTSPCMVSVQEGDRTRIVVEIKEGKNREVRRMFEAYGYRVRQLERTSYAGLTTRGLRRGEWRDLRSREVRELERRVGLR